MFSTGLLFRAYVKDASDYTHEQTPFPDAIASVADWQQLTRFTPGALFDEYGTQHDIAEFWNDLKPGEIDWGTQAGMNAFQDDQGFWLTYTNFGGPHP